MNKRNTLLAAMGIVAVVVIGMLTGLFQQKDYMSMEYPVVQVPVDEVHTIRITTAEHAIVLEKKDSGWEMTSPIASPVEDPPVNAILRRMRNLELDMAVTAERSRYAEFGVTPDLGRRLELEWPGGRQHLTVAGYAEMFQSDYVLIDGDPRVFFLPRRFGLVDHPRSWRDKRVTFGPMESMRAVAVEGPDRNYEVQRSPDGSFSLASGEPVDAEAARRLFSQYAQLRSDGFADDVALADVADDPTVTVRIVRESGVNVVFYKDAMIHLNVGVEGQQTVHQMASNRLAVLAPPKEDLVAGQ